jgi:hypothetical protein
LDGTQTTGASLGARVVMPMSITVSSVSMTIKGTPTGAALIANIRKNGTTIFSVRPQIKLIAKTDNIITIGMPVNDIFNNLPPVMPIWNDKIFHVYSRKAP